MCCKLLVRIIVTGCTSVQIDSSNHRNRIVSDENNCQSSKRLSTTNVTQSEAFTSCQPDETTELTSTTADYSYGKNSPNQSVDDNQSVGASFVIEALLTTQYPESVVNETEYWKKKFNNDPEAWDDFDKTSFNALVLVKLIDDWLTHLKSPVLRMQDLLSLQQNPLFEEDILTSLEIFEKVS
ncbi:Protein tyrosine phosphatase domain-containing protein 1 [Schistosoma haematobium]|uniref:Protein tyrosine phosphatase domain-containing protein 1 n=1 Tax=Schistosoma haematobium TaxID=6185 RepID=A0A922LJV8_SCHHA|nr:Protein tyrosine phosphatase domain-containing protein 1 [Schistosoma haematobium]KAH9587580.1 Protein tyrosine phosphatase domain-containing protein 1 [Schistosoma haematobium]